MEKKKPTVLLVTHDREEAFDLAHRIVHLKGSPVTSYEAFSLTSGEFRKIFLKGVTE